GGWDVLVIVAWLLDLYRLPAAGRLTVRRMWMAPAALSVPSRVQLTFYNESRVRIHASIVDHVPRQLRAEPPSALLDIPPGAHANVDYEIVPAERGEAIVGDVYIRYRTAFRVAE